jgi:ubiquinol-cytochrome c reductase cytochrome b subunit
VDTSALRSTFFKPFHLFFFWFFARDAISLGWIGQEIVESPFIERANFVTTSYFAYFLPLLPFLGFLETSLIHRALNISAAYEADGVLLFSSLDGLVLFKCLGF